MSGGFATRRRGCSMKRVIVFSLLLASSLVAASEADDRVEAIREFLGSLVGQYSLPGSAECSPVKIAITPAPNNTDPRYDYTCITFGEAPNVAGWTCLYSPDVDMDKSCDDLS